MTTLRRAAVLMACVAWGLACLPAAAREVVDMDGRRVTVPDPIRRIYVGNDPPAIFLTSLAPDLLVGMPFPVPAAARRFLPPAVAALPTVGSAFRASPERLLTLDIDVAVAWNMPGAPHQFAEQMAALGKPTLLVDASPFARYPATFRFLGRLLHREARAEELARALEDTSARLDAALGSIPDAQRVRVYYADTADGLRSQCAGAFRGEVVRLAGGFNVMRCETPEVMAAGVTVDLEKLLVLDPDVIVARTRAIADTIRADPGWGHLRAVRAGRVLSFPELPFNWAERPHSQFKMLAVQWLANQLYPDRYPFDFGRATKDFYRLFFGMELTDDDIARLRH